MKILVKTDDFAENCCQHINFIWLFVFQQDINSYDDIVPHIINILEAFSIPSLATFIY